MSIIDSLTTPSFSPKDPGETVFLAFDFSALMTTGLTLSTPVCTAVTRSGTDAAPSAVLSGSPTITGSKLVQRVTGGVALATYAIKAQVDASDGSRFVLVGLLPVRAG